MELTAYRYAHNDVTMDVVLLPISVNVNLDLEELRAPNLARLVNGEMTVETNAHA